MNKFLGMLVLLIAVISAFRHQVKSHHHMQDDVVQHVDDIWMKNKNTISGTRTIMCGGEDPDNLCEDGIDTVYLKELYYYPDMNDMTTMLGKQVIWKHNCEDPEYQDNEYCKELKEYMDEQSSMNSGGMYGTDMYDTSMSTSDPSMSMYGSSTDPDMSMYNDSSTSMYGDTSMSTTPMDDPTPL
jgi:hypothetical protein